MARQTLGKSVQRIYDFICEYATEHGYPPTVREIGQAVNLRSPSTVHMHLKTLESLGYIKRDQSKPRALVICERDSGLPADAAESSASPSTSALTVHEGARGMTTLPLVGRVAAGEPILAEQNIEELVPLPANLVGDDNSFLLRVKGESMINAGILDDDLIVVRETRDAEDGQVVVALVDDSATVKTYYREDGRIRLQPENDAMEPIYVTNPTILGRVTGLIRTSI